MRFLLSISFIVGLFLLTRTSLPADEPKADAGLQAGFGEADITPPLGKDKKPVYLAGFGQNRRVIFFVQ